MKTPKPQSGAPAEGVSLTPEQRRMGERNLARLLVVTHRQGVDAAMEKWQRMKKDLPTKGQNSPDA